jgi:hypothetical protein
MFVILLLFTAAKSDATKDQDTNWRPSTQTIYLLVYIHTYLLCCCLEIHIMRHHVQEENPIVIPTEAPWSWPCRYRIDVLSQLFKYIHIECYSPILMTNTFTIYNDGGHKSIKTIQLLCSEWQSEITKRVWMETINTKPSYRMQTIQIQI